MRKLIGLWMILSVFGMIMMILTLAGCGVGNGNGVLDSELTDPYMDPLALSMGHQHGPQSETAAEKNIHAVWTWSNPAPKAGEPVQLKLMIKDGTDKPIGQFDIVHEKYLHLVIVSKDLQQFQHVHPIYQGGGLFELSVVLPAGGDYKLFADFTPTGRSELTRSTTVSAVGEREADVPLKLSESLVATVGNTEVTLTFGHLMAQMTSSMTYTFREAGTRKPVKDLELYLGAVGHIIGIDETKNHYMHIHPLNWGSTGPQAGFAALFPKSGVYKLWGQFKRDGTVFTVPFVVQVPGA